MKIKIFSILIIIFGISLTGYAVYEIAFTEVKAKEAVKKAKQVVQGNPEEVSQSENISKPEQGSVVGLLTLPKIEAELAIVEGTDPDDLEKGVGHYKGSYFPNENGQIVLSGHRDTVFKRVGELEIGDEMTVETSKGNFSYQIESMKIVDADDTSIITLQNQEEELILTTCYPFGFIGNAPQRYIIYAKRVL